MITVDMLTKIRRMYFRDKLSIREIARRTNLSRNTISKWLKKEAMQEPKYPPLITSELANILHSKAASRYEFARFLLNPAFQ
ncbi:transcriptional regulator with XRE-family HTH domain [Undibacterium sp. GrIS 1.8]